MSDRITCDLCGRDVPTHAHYIVRIDVYADPSMPEMWMHELEEMDFPSTYVKLFDQMKHMSADELQDQVHRQMEYHLCPACQRDYLANPLGKPRGRPPDAN
jgi:hypothetical protein